MENIGSALVITVIGMGVIFVVLTLLMATIVALNTAFPYKKTPPPQSGATTGATETETVAVIQAAITAYLKRKKGED